MLFVLPKKFCKRSRRY